MKEMMLKPLVVATLCCLCAGTPALANTQQPGPRISPQMMMTCNDGNGRDPLQDVSGANAGSLANAHLANVIPRKTFGHGAALAVIGSTQKEVDAKFATVIENNFANGASEQVLSRLSDKELADIAHYYQSAAGTHGTPLLRTLASRVSDKAMLRVAQFFDRAAVEDAVNTYASNEVQNAFTDQIASVHPFMRMLRLQAKVAAVVAAVHLRVQARGLRRRQI